MLGIDLGTSGVRAVVLGRVGILAAGAARFLPGVRHDPAALWAAVAAVLDGMDLSGVGALAVDGTSGTLLAVLADGTPVGRSSLHSDPGTVPARAAAMLACPGTARVLHESDWIAGHFFGLFDVTDWNNALKTGFDPVAPAWRDGAGLPRVVAPGTALGRVTAAAARRFGLPTDAMVAAGTTDGCASFLGTGADQVGDGVTALGSTMTLKLLAGAPVSAPEWGIYSHRLPSAWLPGGASNTGGALRCAGCSRPAEALPTRHGRRYAPASMVSRSCQRTTTPPRAAQSWLETCFLLPLPEGEGAKLNARPGSTAPWHTSPSSGPAAPA